MAVNTVEPRGNLASENTKRGPSPNIWADCPPLEFFENPGLGFVFNDDFTKQAVLVTPTITTQALYGGGYKAFGSSGGTIISNSELGGGLILTESDDNEGFSLATIALPFKIITTGGKLWFEARLKTNTIGDTEHGFFLGLVAQQTLSATVPIAAAGTLADNNFVGFHRLEGDGDQIDCVYKADGVTQVTVQADALTTPLVADTYIKLGMKFDTYDNYLRFYANNLEIAKKLIPSSAGTDFPNDVQLGLCLAALCASNNDAIINLSWWRCAMQLVA